MKKSIKYTSFLAPAISIFGGQKYVVPGWHPVPMETTLDEVYEQWERINYNVEETHSHKPIKEFVTSSKGDKKYTVLYNNGTWDCDCPGFGFRRKCRHIEDIKTKHNM